MLGDENAARRARPAGRSVPFSSAMLTPLMNDRYPGTMGRTHGEMNDMSPATSAPKSDTEPCISAPAPA